MIPEGSRRCASSPKPSPNIYQAYGMIKISNILGTCNYPKTPTAACNVLCQYKTIATPQPPHVPLSAVKFLQRDNTSNASVPVDDANLFTDVT